MAGNCEPEIQELLAPLRALSCLLPEATDIKSEHAQKAASNLTALEKKSVKMFLESGQRCHNILTGNTLLDLKKLVSGTRAMALGKKDTFATDDNKVSSVYELFEKFDTDKDGVLSKAEFRKAIQTLLGDAMSEEEMNVITEQVDANHSQDVDIHEFTVWLYNAGQTPAASTKSQEKEPKKGSEGKVDSAELERLEAEVKTLKGKLAATQAELGAKTGMLKQVERWHEEEVEASLDFWRGIAQNAVATIDQKVCMNDATWLGNGKYGFVLKAKRKRDDRAVVVKMMGLRWAHLAVKEWQYAARMGKHHCIVDYEEVMLHNDDDESIANMCKVGYESGKLKSKKVRTVYPDRFICLTQEFMNQGTVQDWLDHNSLEVESMLVIMKRVAAGLTYMHKNKVAHNDIKPENIMLDKDSKTGEICVKLGDLGCADKSSDMLNDFWQYGMTVFCMTTGVKFGTRKYLPESVGDFCKEIEDAVGKDEHTGNLGDAFKQIPGLIRRVYIRGHDVDQEITMIEVRELEYLQGWKIDGTLIDEDGDEPTATVEEPVECVKKKKSRALRKTINEATARKAAANMGDE